MAHGAATLSTYGNYVSGNEGDCDAIRRDDPFGNVS